MGWWGEFLSSDNSKKDSGTLIAVLLAGPIVFSGLAAFWYYAFWLQKDIGVNLRYLILGLLASGISGVGAFIASRLGKPQVPRPPVKED
jgi:hypothetical protein